MRKIITIGFIITGVIVSCKKEEITPTKPIVAISKDCNCNRVVKVNEIILPGKSIYDCWMINDCSKIETFETFNDKVVIGECKN